MTKYFCDRCCKEMGFGSGLLFEVELKVYTTPVKPGGGPEKYELCKNCLKELRAFLTPLPKVQEANAKDKTCLWVDNSADDVLFPYETGCGKYYGAVFRSCPGCGGTVVYKDGKGE